MICYTTDNPHFQFPVNAMLKSSVVMLVAASIFLSSGLAPVRAQQNANYAYLGLEPDIVTNYLGHNARKLGYVSVTIELMISDVEQLEIAEHHMPLLRATAIEIFGRQPAEKVKSLKGREEIRMTLLRTLQQHMKEETGGEVVKNVIFTKYLYQG